MNSSAKIAILTDFHYGPPLSHPRRRTEIADILLLRAVHRLNRFIQPDVTLILGDLVDDGTAPDKAERLEHLRAILDKLTSPTVVIPGNHDGDVNAFYRVFERPQAIADIGGIHFLPFIDREEPGYNASRSDVDLARFRQARQNYNGPIVALQHVCLAPPERLEMPYNYTNAQAIVDAMAESGVTLSIGGHYHKGAPVIHTEHHSTFINAPALCEAPFHFLVVTLDGGQVTAERHQLAMPANLRLVDNHVHTQLAYCAENVTVERAIALARDFGLAGVGFAEHSGQLYFDSTQYWGRQALQEGINGAQAPDNRMADFLALKHTFASDTIRFGLEVDCDYDGNPVLKPEDRHHADFLIGAIHGLPSEKIPGVTDETLQSEFLTLLEKFLQSGIHILAHPFRIFRKAGWEPPETLFLPVAKLLREHQVAAEINFHKNEPSPEFMRLCLELGVKLSFGSDTHNLYEVGEFTPHLHLLKDIGFNGDITDVLLSKPA
ncbi:MAG: metallophosphoesterase [Anaerolineae bacterium]|nr:metallophosphoesterase [Anaerolineae bacterium]